IVLFFFQAEDGIRDLIVTGVQTCALPIYELGSGGATTHFQVFTGPDTLFPGVKGRPVANATDGAANTILVAQATRAVPWSKPQRSEERRVGKESTMRLGVWSVGRKTP